MNNFKRKLLLLLICLLVTNHTVAFAAEPTPISMLATIRNTESINIRSGPSSSYPSLTFVTEGGVFEVLDEEDDWYKVNYNGIEGYVFWKYVNFIEKPINIEVDNKLIGNSIIQYHSRSNRDVNLSIACSKINGTIIQPGEEFNWKNVVGQTSATDGYLNAPVIISGKSVNAIGGGVCQVSTTLYNATFDCEGLVVTERHKHSKASAYSTNDATVAMSSGKNFRFRNDNPYPIIIEMSSYKGIVSAEIYNFDAVRQ